MNVAEVPTSGELRWNIKQSFRDYVGELPDGQETWTGEVGSITDGDLVFPAIGATVEAGTDRKLTFKFGGGVRFAGYRGMLRVDLKDPWVEVVSGSAIVSADSAPPGSPSRRTPIATVAGHPALLDDGVWVWDPDSTALTAAGAALLGSVYPPGTEAAGFRFHVTPS